MFKFAPPNDDPAALDGSELEPLAGLAQALRWFTARASHALFLSAMHETIANAALEGIAGRRNSPDTVYMLDRAVLNGLVLELRAIHDKDRRSLASKRIAEGLADPALRAELLRHCYWNSDEVPSVEAQMAYLDYVQRYTEIMSREERRSTRVDHPLSAKVQHVRLMSNREIAHSTLKQYRLSGADLAEVVMATCVLALAIQEAVGPFANDIDFAFTERRGYEAAGELLGVEVDSEPYNTNMIRTLLPKWVALGGEWPRYPEEFQRCPAVAEPARRWVK